MKYKFLYNLFMDGVSEYAIYEDEKGNKYQIKPLCGTCRDINGGCSVFHGHVTCDKWVWVKEGKCL